MIKSSLFSILILISAFTSANNQIADSLKYEIINTQNTVKKAKLQLDYCWEIKYLDLDQCVRISKKAITVLTHANDLEGIAKGHSYMGVYMYLQDSIPEAIQYLEKAVEMLSTQSNPDLLSRTYNNLGVFYGALYDNEQALKYYQKSLEVKKKIGDEDISSNLINISTILYDQGKYQECIEVNEQALIYALKNDDYESIAVIYSNLGAANERLGNYKASINYALQALGLYQSKIKNESAESRTYSNLGANYLSQDLLVDARYYFMLAHDLNTKNSNVSNLAVSNNNLAEIERRSNNLKKAKMYAEKALELGRKSNYIEEIRISYHEVSLIAEDQKNYKESLRYYKLYITLSDSVLEENQTISAQKALAKNRLTIKNIQDQTEQEANSEHRKKIDILKEIFITLLVLFLIRIIIHFLFPKTLPLLIIVFNYLIPYLASIYGGMYVLLKTDLPQTLNLFQSFVVLLSLMIMGVSIHLFLNYLTTSNQKND